MLKKIFISLLLLTEIFSNNTKNINNTKIEINNIEFNLLKGGKNGSFYCDIINNNDCDIILYKVSIAPNISKLIELHDHVSVYVNNQETLSMQKIPFIQINKKSVVNLKKGSKHVMLMNLSDVQNICSKNLTVTFYFKKNNSILKVKKCNIDISNTRLCKKY